MRAHLVWVLAVTLAAGSPAAAQRPAAASAEPAAKQEAEAVGRRSPVDAAQDPGGAAASRASGLPAHAPAALTAGDYERAERLLSRNVQELVHGGAVRPNWLEEDRFWYRNRVAGGHEFVLVDAPSGTRERAFDHERLAATLSAELEKRISGLALPFQNFEYVNDGWSIRFEAEDARWTCDLTSYECERAPRPEPAERSIASPDGRLAAFIRDHDLWVREVETGEEVRLTTDGVEHYGYATDNQGWRRTDMPVLLWSPDSRRIATYRLDERGVGEMHLLETGEPRPEVHTWKYALPGDTVVPMHERVVLDVAERRVVRLDTPPDHQRTSSCCGLTRGEAWADVEWSADGSRLAFVSVSRDYRDVALRLADPVTGAVRTVLEDDDPLFFESNASGRGVPNWRVLHERGEVLWFTREDGWGHLYLHDLATGERKRRLTGGEWNVLDVLRVDEAAGAIYFTGVGREPGRNPYHRHLYRLSLDAGAEPVLLTPEDADHGVALSPSGRYFVHARSTVEASPVTVLRRADGSAVRALEEADISALEDAGWRPPAPFTVLARDGETELYGLLFRPSDFDPERKYPIINRIYPGPQAGSLRGWDFSPSHSGEAQALAELGFVVVQIDALGTPQRSREFHAAYYGDMGDNGLEDQIAGMRQLAERHPWIDLDRVGIYGHSGGGFASAGAILRYPDFFHVAVASAGNHDNRGYTYYWGEKWHGLLERYDDGSDSYESQANHLLAENLRGRLLLSYGTMDANVHPNTTLLLVNELIRHNKDFDLIVFPNRGHGYAGEPYKIRRTWDYFVTHLLGARPPREYRLADQP